MNRWRLVAIILVILLAGGFVLHSARNREPRFQGRTLNEWLVAYPHATFSSPLDADALALRDASSNAVRQIGTNALPYLLKKVSAKDTALVYRLKSLMPLHLTDPSLERLQGFEGLRILDPEAMSAVPALATLTKDPDAAVRYHALLSLQSINPDAETLLPILLQTIHDSDKAIRTVSAYSLNGLFPEAAEKEKIYQEFPLTRPVRTHHNSTNAPIAR